MIMDFQNLYWRAPQALFLLYCFFYTYWDSLAMGVYGKLNIRVRVLDIKTNSNITTTDICEA